MAAFRHPLSLGRELSAKEIWWALKTSLPLPGAVQKPPPSKITPAKVASVTPRPFAAQAAFSEVPPITPVWRRRAVSNPTRDPFAPQAMAAAAEMECSVLGPHVHPDTATCVIFKRACPGRFTIQPGEDCAPSGSACRMTPTGARHQAGADGERHGH